MEVEYALAYHIYQDLLTGETTERALANEKTRNRNQTRIRANPKQAIGLPIKGRAGAKRNQKRKPRHRIDTETGEQIHWEDFRKAHANLSWCELQRKWKSYPRKFKRIKYRVYQDEEMTWSCCYSRYGDYFERHELHRWFIKLPRAHSRT